MPTLSLELTFENSTKTVISEKRLKDAARDFLVQMKQEGNMILDVSIVGEAAMQKLNQQYRHVNAPTDVLSFPVHDSFPPTTYNLKPKTYNLLLGSIVIWPALVSDHWRHGHYGAIAEDQSMIYVLCHGLLHLLGHTHDTDASHETFQNHISAFLNTHST